MNTTMRDTLWFNPSLQNSALRQHPRHPKFMLHAPKSRFTSTLYKPLNYGAVYISFKRIINTASICTASSENVATTELTMDATDTTKDVATYTAAVTNTAQPTSPLYQPIFDAMYEKLAVWRSKYRTTIVPRNAHDAGQLGDWIAAIRRLHRRGTLPAWAIEKLDELDMTWKVDVLTAKWHANFHATREFKEAHGGNKCNLDVALPPDWGTTSPATAPAAGGKDSVSEGDNDGEDGNKDAVTDVGVECEAKEGAVRADWVEAARWLERQRELFITEKLTDYRVWVLKSLLGVRLRRPYAPRRKNMHPALLKQNAAFKKLVAKDEAKAAAAAAAAGEAGVVVAQGEKDVGQ